MLGIDALPCQSASYTSTKTRHVHLFFLFVTPACSLHVLLFQTVLAAIMVAPRRWKSGGEPQPVEPSPPSHCTITAQPGAPNKPAEGSQPSELSRRRTRPTNATARPGLPDKPVPRHTSEQKRADEEQVRQTKQVKKSALEEAYQRISAVQADMVLEQEEVTKDRAAVRPKPRIVRKKVQEGQPEAPLAAVLGSLPVPGPKPCKPN